MPLSVLTLNASLKHGPEPSNTEEVANMVVEQMRSYGDVTVESIRLSDANLPVGLSYNLGNGDEWPSIVEKMIAADIILFATPIWWGGRSSLMQRVIERMDSFDEGQIPGGREAMLNKVAGIVITGSEDGAQAVMAGMMEVLSFLNFTLPPQCCTYWVGEVGMDPKTDAERRRANPAVKHMADTTAKNLVYYAQLLKDHPQEKKA
ncbi:MAG TPA: NAD(P)H-dependent oxidoreductase [Candidatus Paceibacterota bacterium]|nr:NAD(P)H-dependent oxidoreductase [Candidatus Paceibacterota bacterium]